MTVGHLALAGSRTSPLDKVVHLPLWVSGAAGFVFLSGVSVALLSRARGGPSRHTRRWVAIRGAVLAVIAVSLNLLGLAWFELVGRPDWYPASDASLTVLVSGRWWLAGTDVLAMYAAFLTVVALAGPWPSRAPRATLLVSAAVYAAAVFLPDVGPTEDPANRPIWDLPAWQIVFFAGLVAGWNWTAVTDWLDHHRRQVLLAGTACLVAIAALRLGLAVANRGVDPLDLRQLEAGPLSWLLDKQSLGPLRLVLIGLTGPAAYLLARRSLPLDHLFTSAGARSLRVYVVSTLAMFLWPISTGRIPWLVVAELQLAAATVLVLSVGLLPAVGRGRPWSF
jgi:hypothetical protein